MHQMGLAIYVFSIKLVPNFFHFPLFICKAYSMLLFTGKGASTAVVRIGYKNRTE